jgi:hypothetical protein
MSVSANLEDTPSAMKGLFRSRPRMGKLGPWDEKAGVDDPVVCEDRPWPLESSDPDINTGDSLSLEDDDFEEPSTLEAIKTQNEVPKDNAKTQPHRRDLLE